MNSKVTPGQQHPQTHTHTPRPSERPIADPKGKYSSPSEFRSGKGSGGSIPLFTGSIADPAAAQEGEADRHSRSLCEELRTHGGDRYSWRDKTEAPHRLSHTLAICPLIPGPCGHRHMWKGRAAGCQARAKVRQCAARAGWWALAMVLKGEISGAEKKEPTSLASWPPAKHCRSPGRPGSCHFDELCLVSSQLS